MKDFFKNIERKMLHVEYVRSDNFGSNIGGTMVDAKPKKLRVFVQNQSRYLGDIFHCAHHLSIPMGERFFVNFLTIRIT